jgi:hypothetical protein
MRRQGRRPQLVIRARDRQHGSRRGEGGVPAEVRAAWLRSPEQLPDLDGDELRLVWGQDERGEGEQWTVIRFGDRVISSEPAFWESVPRFGEVKALLRQRYGSRFHSLTPSEESKMYLYGDLVGSEQSLD